MRSWGTGSDWGITRMGGLTGVEGLRSRTPLLAIVGSAALIVTALLALVVPLV